MKLLALACAAAGVTAAPTLRSKDSDLPAGECTDFLIPVQAQAQNRLVLAPTDDLTSPSGVTSFLTSLQGAASQLTGFIPQSGTYAISGRYCAPAKGGSIPPERASHVQLLLHGIPYDKEYWQGLGYPNTGDINNYVAYANRQGYPTLSIDNLGKGQSSHPDPVLVVQQALEQVIVQEIIAQLRSGSIPTVPQASKVIYVGHSAGSVTGNGVAVNYPDAAFDAAILTGYTYTLAQSEIGQLTDGPEPASVQNASRFGNLDPGYLTFGSVEGKRNTFYGADGTFDAGLPEYDVHQGQDVVSLGDLLTVANGLETAHGYKGDIFVLTGEQDSLFCSLGSRALATPSCGKGDDNLLAKTQSLWPDVRSYEYYEVPGAGHAVTLHNSAQEQFAKAHDFLSRHGY